MKFFLGTIVGLILAVSIAVGAAYVACDGAFKENCFGEDIHFDFDHDD